jgi:hypothetical protein
MLILVLPKFYKKTPSPRLSRHTQTKKRFRRAASLPVWLKRNCGVTVFLRRTASQAGAERVLIIFISFLRPQRLLKQPYALVEPK